MIAFIKGKVFAFGFDWVIVDTMGVGYKISFAHPEELSLNQEILLYTYQHVREDGNSLYGFLTNEELKLFEQLISVKGLGPKTALTMMSAVSASRIISAIEQQDVDFLKTTPGIGTKTASQIVLDLKGKLVESQSTQLKPSSKVNDALAGLKALGYRNNELQGLEKILSGHPELTIDELVKKGLQWILQRKGGL